MTATYYIGDSIEVMSKLPENSVDLVLTSPPFLALRSYLPADHPDKGKEGGSQSTPGEFIDWLLDVVEACDRVLAPHGSLCFELGDTYSGSTADGGDNRGNERYPNGRSDMGGSRAFIKPKKGAWPLAKSLSLIPESFRWAMVYGHNPFTGRKTEPWRLRNVIRWVRPNPPVGALGDKFRPATSELMVFCKAKDRFFDLDAVRLVNNPERMTEPSMKSPWNQALGNHTGDGEWHPAGAPPLDWWNIPLLEGEEPTKYGPKEQPKSHPRTAKGVESAPRSAKSADRGGNWASLPETSRNPGSAPLGLVEHPPRRISGRALRRLAPRASSQTHQSHVSRVRLSGVWGGEEEDG